MMDINSIQEYGITYSPVWINLFEHIY